MTTENIKQMFEKGFATHKATLIQNTDRFLIIDWRRADGSGDYYVNYIVDKKRGSLIVSGFMIVASGYILVFIYGQMAFIEHVINLVFKKGE